jgi:glycosyltransferase involved in cell wall biosynthesis
MPFISLLTIAYNAEDYILRCYNNILDQTFQNWEWVVVNDGSKDKTLDIISKIDDSRIKIISYEINQGRGYARNKGLEYCNGEWVSIFDVDDFHFPDKLACIYEKSTEQIDFFCSYAVLVNNSLDIKGYRGFTEANGVFPKGFVHPTMACKTDIIKNIKYALNPGPGAPGEDAHVLWILSLMYNGYWHQDALTIYQEEREISIHKAYWSNFGHLKTIINLKNLGIINYNYKYIIVLFRYLIKLIVLRTLFLFPQIYKYSLRRRSNGLLLESWILADEKFNYLSKIKKTSLTDI